MKKNPVVHFEMPTKDRKRVAEFYSAVFGWKANLLGEDMGNYITVETTETDGKQMVKTPGAINGGFYPMMDDPAMNKPSVVIAVDDIKAHMKLVESKGGKVIGEPMDIPGVGSYVSFYDTEGNRVGMLQPMRKP